MTTSINQFVDALKEKARTSHDESVSKALCAVAETVQEFGITALQRPAGPQGEQGATGAQGPSGATGTTAVAETKPTS